MYATERFAAGGRGRICFSAISFWLAVLIICFQSASIAAKEINLGEKVSFVIPQQRADLALTQFAEQANVTLVFPYDLVEKKTANGLEGTFTLTEALQKLLDGTGLYPKVSKDGQLSISTTNVQEGDNSMPNKNKLTAAVLAAMAAVSSAQAEEAAKQIEEITVTGSYIRGADTAAANPVASVDMSDLAYTGGTDLTDLMNALPLSSGAENRPDTFTSFYSQGTSNVNLRGLGLSSTLVLINGKRQTISGAKAQDGSVFVDTASIPAIAIKRMDVLKEGAAATYGSDAVAGVVNFITNDDFEGFKIDGSYHELDNFDQSDLNFSMMGGFSVGESTHVVMAASFLERDNLQGFDNPELINSAASGLGAAYQFPYGTTATVADGGPWDGSYDGDRYLPETTRERVGHGECAEFGGRPLGAHDADNPALCGFWYGAHYNIINDESRQQYYASVTHDFESGMKGDVKFFYTNYEVNDNYSVPSLPNLNFPTISASHPDNPFGVDVITFGRHNPTLDPSQSRAAPRDNETIRLEGKLEGEFSNGMNWITSLAYSENTYDISQPEMSQSKYEAALAGNGGPNGDLRFNPFARPDEHNLELLDWLKTDFRNSTSTDLFVFDAVVSGEAFETSAGQAYFAAGMQVRSESYDVSPAENSKIIYDTNGNPTPDHNDFTFLGTVAEISESRSTSALFAELEVPLSDRLSMNAALRYEDLDTDTSLDPKLSFLFKATDQLSLRASWSTSFREPSLSQMHADWVNTANVTEYIDPTNPALGLKNDGSSIFIRVATTGSEDLKPEEADNFNLGLVWEGEAFDARVDYWQVDYSDVITVENAQSVYNEDPLGTAPGSSIIYNAGILSGLSIEYFNAASIDASGLDMEMSYELPLSNSNLKFTAGLSRYLSYDYSDGTTSYDAVGSFNFGRVARSMPEDKASLTALWNDDAHSVFARVNYISSYENNRQGDTIDSYSPVEVQYSYRFTTAGDAEGSVRVGVINLFDEEPPHVTDGANFNYDPKQHDPRGRVLYLKGSYQF